MNSERRQISLGVSDEFHPEGCHIVYLYNDDGEKKRTMARFLQQGLEDGEKVLYLVHDVSPAEMREELCDLGVSAGESERAFDMMTAHYTQCPKQVFSPEFMLNLVGAYYDNALRDGYVGARGAGEMSWALEAGHADFKDLVEYEAKLNDILTAHPLTTVCQYDVRQFSGEIIMELLSVHPIAIVNGQVIKNPFYAAPEQFLGRRRDTARPD